MRRTPAALLLAALLLLSAAQAPAQTSVQAQGQADAQPGVSADPDAPPPFMRRPKAAPRPQTQDLTFASRPAPREFRGIPWGAPVDQAVRAAGLTPVTSPRPLSGTFQRPGEDLRLGQAELRTVAYYFPKGQFRGVGILFEGEANFFLIKDHLLEQFGPGRQVGDRYGWTWPEFNIDLRLRESVGELRYTSEPLAGGATAP